MESTNPSLLTLGQIARECRVPNHQASYAITRYGIEPRQRAGVLRLWSVDDIPAIKSALRRISGGREVAHA